MLIYTATLIAVSGTIFVLAAGNEENKFLEYTSYAIYSMAAITLAYSVYITVIFAQKIKASVISNLERNPFSYRLMHNFSFRTLIFATGSLILSIAYGAFNGVAALISLSIWYGALAVYYILLAFLRGGIIIFHNRKRKGKYTEKTEAELEIRMAKVYKNAGILLVILHLALPLAIAAMVLTDKRLSYAGLMIYATAAYAFYKITMSIYNFFKARRQDDLTVQAVRNINLADAMVSVFALQAALLSNFGDGTISSDIFNIITGGVVCAATLAIGTIMTVIGTKKIKEYKKLTEKN